MIVSEETETIKTDTLSEVKSIETTGTDKIRYSCLPNRNKNHIFWKLCVTFSEFKCNIYEIKIRIEILIQEAAAVNLADMHALYMYEMVFGSQG